MCLRRDSSGNGHGISAKKLFFKWAGVGIGVGILVEGLWTWRGTVGKKLKKESSFNEVKIKEQKRLPEEHVGDAEKVQKQIKTSKEVLLKRIKVDGPEIIHAEDFQEAFYVCLAFEIHMNRKLSAEEIYELVMKDPLYKLVFSRLDATVGPKEEKFSELLRQLIIVYKN